MRVTPTRVGLEAQVDPEDYYAAMESGSAAERAFHPARVRLVRRAVGRRGGRLLDVGAGSGCLAIPLAADGHEVTAVELGAEHLPRLLAYAERRGLEIAAVQANAARLPFADASFDVVLLASVVHLTPSPGPILAEAERVCRPGGRLVIAGPWRWHPKSSVAVKTLLRGGRPPTTRTWPFTLERLRPHLLRSRLVSKRRDVLMGYVATTWEVRDPD